MCYNKLIKKISIRVSFGTTEIVSKNEKIMPMNLVDETVNNRKTGPSAKTYCREN